MEERLKTYLRPGEQVRWQGRPAPFSLLEAEAKKQILLKWGLTVALGGGLLAVAAGPACNLLLWALLSLTGWPSLAPFAGAHLILGALNLLPVRPMDGGRLLWLLTALCTEPYTADRVAYAVGAVASAALLVLCLYLTLTTGAGLFLLPGVLWLAVKGVLPNGAKPDKISCYKK